jgi:hypothetical protein
LRATVLASVPWFLQDLGTYGIGIFTPTILASSIGHRTAHVRSLADLISNDDLAANRHQFFRLGGDGHVREVGSVRPAATVPRFG